MDPITPSEKFFSNPNCACDPAVFCLWHYGKLSPREQSQVKRQLNLTHTRAPALTNL